ncbi:Lipopolysaccharide kinase (Kdo/WaaP) family protein [Stutzerimonas kunmingensis]|nr:Lipopolysaccharide kinase (Kdo/WaaP) family protein [Stutzerimonas kunmingensis]
MNEFFSVADRPLLEAHGLASFDALWAVQLESVDMPNTGRGGWSSVFRLELGDTAYYLKRQSNYLIHSLRYPFGEPTFAFEFRNIQRYRSDAAIDAAREAIAGRQQCRMAGI